MRVLVIGDIIRDSYIYGKVERLNPEGPVPLVQQVAIKETRGGAALVYQNLISLGVDATLYDYPEKYQSVKTRIVADGHSICRIDNEPEELFNALGYKVLNDIMDIDVTVYDFCILSDYNKGALTFSAAIIDHIKNTSDCLVIVDPKKTFDCYTGAWMIKPNLTEYTKYRTAEWTGNTLITSHETNVLELGGKQYRSPVCANDVVDVTGAGDCFLAAFVYALTNHFNYQRCLDIATKAASLSVQHQGTYILTLRDVNSTVVFTNGCFDILHRGHIEYLEQSKKLGDKLVVGLNSDASVKRLKGDSRPINNQDDRRKALRALRCVDEVYIFDEETPYNLINSIQPDIITKGGDYKPEDVIGNNLADVVILPYVENYSTTNIVSKLND